MPGFRGGKVPSQESIDKADKIREEMVKEHLDIILKHRKGMSKNDALDEIEQTIDYLIDCLYKNELMNVIAIDKPKTYDSAEIKMIFENLKKYIETFKDEEGNHD